VCIDGILLAGNHLVWKQRAKFHRGLGVELVKMLKTKRNYPSSSATSADILVKCLIVKLIGWDSDFAQE
jgi:hypothetical protein